MIEPAKTHILIVDDEPLIRSTIAGFLRRRGYNVFVAASGYEALEIAQTNRIHLVFSDVRMPNGDGLSLLKEARKLQPTPPTVVLMTGFSEMAQSSSDTLGAFAILTKPFSTQVLLSIVERALEV